MSDQRTPEFGVRLDDPTGIVYCRWHPGSDCTLDLARQVTRQVAAFTADGPRPLLVDVRELTSFTRDARRHFAANGGGACAVALLTSSAVSRMLANFFIGTGHPVVPVRMFTDESAAQTWLHSAS